MPKRLFATSFLQASPITNTYEILDKTGPVAALRGEHCLGNSLERLAYVPVSLSCENFKYDFFSMFSHLVTPAHGKELNWGFMEILYPTQVNAGVFFVFGK